tara:strand:- start:343 stop:816 length:474 start_codon:yes stop_codon:yes gene_type:complete
MGTLESNVIKALEPIINQSNDQEDPRVIALSKYLDLALEPNITYESNDIYSFDGEEYMILTDDEADEKVAEYIKDSVWAFNPSFLSCHSGIDQDVFKLLQDKCESANEAILKLIKDFDHFVEDAVASDGRGHFLSSYDGYENEQEHDNETYYIYRTN